MPVNSTHAQYDENASLWKRCRDVIEGEDAVKTEGTLYLPKPSGLNGEEYQNYKLRALFFNATRRTLGGYLGMIFRKDPEVAVPGVIEPYLNDVTLSATTFPDFCRYVTSEILSVGRAGVLVDVQDERVASGRRPYFVPYAAEQIINWRTDTRDGKEILTLVVLSETMTEPGDDEFTDKEYQQYRVLDLATADENGQPLSSPRYRVRVYREVSEEKESAIALQYEAFPTFANGDYLDFIPFVLWGAEGYDAAVQPPPMLDLISVNLSHYLTSADLEWARYWVAFPGIFVCGIDTEQKLTIGGGRIWKFENPETTVGTIGGESRNFEALESADQNKKRMMATLGARLLEEQKADSESAETVRLRQSGEQSTLQSIANLTAYAIAQALRWMAQWSGANPDDVTLRFNSEYVAPKMDPALLAQLLSAVQAGQMSFETFYQNLVRGGVARENITAEEERQAIDAQTPQEAL